MMRASGALFLGIVLMAAALSAQEPAKNPGATSVRAAKETTSNLPTEAEYKIGPQDLVRIDVWKEPDISRTIPVRPDGKISLPLLNDVQAAGLTALQLADSIRDG